MFKFNPQIARTADTASGGRIAESGAYTVAINQAYLIEGAAPKLSKAMVLEVTTSAEETGKLFFWYQKADGTDNDYAVAAINLVLGVLKLGGLNTKHGEIDAYDYDEKRSIKKAAEIFPDLIGKKLKMAIQAKYDVYNGKNRVQIEMKCPATLDGFTVSEVLDGATKPVLFQKAIDRLKPLGPKPEESSTGIQDHPAHRPTIDAPKVFDDMDDSDVPF